MVVVSFEIADAVLQSFHVFVVIPLLLRLHHQAIVFVLQVVKLAVLEL